LQLRGLIPIDGESLGEATVYGDDRFFIDIRTEGEDDAAHDERLAIDRDQALPSLPVGGAREADT
jgi:hypothetical protein